MDFAAELQAVHQEAEALILLAIGLRVQGDDPRTLTPAELRAGVAYVLAAKDEVYRKIAEVTR